MKKIVLLLLSVACTSSQGAITTFGDSSTFDYLYEMDDQPNNQDLDGNGGDDWWDANVPAVSGGLLSFVNSGNNAQILRGDFGGSIWRELVKIGAAADWTLEASVRKDGGTQGAIGWFGIATANLGESNSSDFQFMDDRVRFNDTDYLNGTNFADGSFHTVRIAHDAADNEYYVWVNDILLNSDLSTPLLGTNGTNFDNSTFIGDYTGAIAGDFSIDYLRLDSSAIGVVAVPEPSSMLMIGFGVVLGTLSLRRRS